MENPNVFFAASQLPLKPTMLAVSNSYMSNKPHFVEVSRGYLFNSNGKKVFAKLYATPCSNWKKLKIFKGYDFSLDWNKWSLAKEAFSVEVSGTEKCLTITTKLPMTIDGYQEDFGVIAQVIANNVGFKF